jgi:hypothetical protein
MSQPENFYEKSELPDYFLSHQILSDTKLMEGTLSLLLNLVLVAYGNRTGTFVY